MSDDRWGWVTTPAIITPPDVDGVEQKKHFTNPPVTGAGRDALDLWAPAAQPIPAADSDLAYSAVNDDTVDDDVEIGGHGPGDDAPTAQWAAVEPHPADRWQPAPTGDGLDQLVVDGRRKKARTRSLRRAGIVAVFLAVLAAVVVIGVTEVLPGGDSTPAPVKPAAGSAPVGWCATGVSGDTTTVATAGDQKSPTGAVAAFLSGLIDARSVASARAVMAPTAPAPTLDQLTQWVTRLPAATNRWCAQITTTDSTARVLVDLRLHSGNTPVQVGSPTTFYVSATTPTDWVIDAIVSDEGSQP